MRTAKCVVTLLTVALVGTAAVTATSGQDNAAQEPSNTRAVDCLVRITADPAIVPLNDTTVMNLIYSPGMRRKATEVLNVERGDPLQFVAVEWLSGETTQAATTQEQDEDMSRQMEQIYGPEYARMMGISAGMSETKGGGSTSSRSMGGFGGMRGAATGSASSPAIEHSAVIKLTVELPDSVKPLAQELMDALVVNLRNKLIDAHDRYGDRLEVLLASARSQRERAEQNVQSAGTASSPGATRVREQLDRTVDVSVLTPQTPISEAIEILRNAVSPPLQIVAMWKDLLEGANVEPSSAIDIDGMPSVRLGTALDLLVKGISDPLPGAPAVVYRIRDNVVVIGTSATLGMANTSAMGAMTQTDIRALAAQKDELTRAIRSLELNQVSMEARRKAMYMQMEEARQQADRRLAQDTVTQELEKLVQISTSHLELLQQRVTAGQMPQAELASAQESVARARIELARRREELAKLTGGGRIEQYESELSKMAIDEAESRARLDVLRRQLADVQGQLTQASTFDPEAARIRVAQETLNLANRRVGELETRLATLQPPTVTIIGAN